MASRRDILRSTGFLSMVMVGGCLESSRCETVMKLQFNFDDPRPGYKEQLSPILFESLPESERQFVSDHMANTPRKNSRKHTICSESNIEAQSFCDRVVEMVEKQDGSPWGGAPHVYLIRNQYWYDIWLKKDGEMISY